MVEISGFEPLTFAMRTQRSTNWAIPPCRHTYYIKYIENCPQNFCGRQAKLRFAQNLPILSEFPSGNSLSPTHYHQFFSYPFYIFNISQFLLLPLNISQFNSPEHSYFTILLYCYLGKRHYSNLFCFLIIWLFYCCLYLLFALFLIFVVIFPFSVFGFLMLSSFF